MGRVCVWGGGGGGGGGGLNRSRKGKSSSAGCRGHAPPGKFGNLKILKLLEMDLASRFTFTKSF